MFSVLILLVLICLLEFAPHIHLDLLCSGIVLFLTPCINLFNKTTHLLCETSVLKPLTLFARKLNDNKNLILVSFTSASAKRSVWYLTDCSPSSLTICTSNHVKTPPDRLNNPYATKSGLEHMLQESDFQTSLHEDFKMYLLYMVVQFFCELLFSKLNSVTQRTQRITNMSGTTKVQNAGESRSSSVRKQACVTPCFYSLYKPSFLYLTNVAC